MKVYFDTEFTNFYKPELISIGLIADNCEGFYGEIMLDSNTRHSTSEFVKTNVFPNTIAYKKTNDGQIEYYPYYRLGTKEEIALMLRVWFSQFDTVELVSDCCHYDMYLLCDLFGGADNLPKNICPVCYDINQDIAAYLEISQREAFDIDREQFLSEKFRIEMIESAKHNAYFDACVICEIYIELQKRK